MNNCLQAPQKVKNVLNRLKHGKIRLRFSKRIHVKDFHAIPHVLLTFGFAYNVATTGVR